MHLPINCDLLQIVFKINFEVWSPILLLLKFDLVTAHHDTESWNMQTIMIWMMLYLLKMFEKVFQKYDYE